MHDLGGQENVFSKECRWNHPWPMGGRRQWTTERGFCPLFPLVNSSTLHFTCPLRRCWWTEHQLTAVVVNQIAHPYIGLPSSSISLFLACIPAPRKNISKECQQSDFCLSLFFWGNPAKAAQLGNHPIVE